MYSDAVECTETQSDSPVCTVCFPTQDIIELGKAAQGVSLVLHAVTAETKGCEAWLNLQRVYCIHQGRSVNTVSIPTSTRLHYSLPFQKSVEEERRCI